MIMIINLIFKICNFSVIVCFLTELLTLDILFSTVVNADFVAKLLILGILFSNSASFAILTKSATSGTLFFNSNLSVSYYFLAQSD